VFAYLQQVFSYAVPPVAAIFIMGMFWRRGTAPAAFWTLVFGHVVGLAQLVAAQAGLLSLHFTIVAGLTTGLCIAAFVVLSWLTPAPAPDRLVNTLWTKDLSQPDRPHPWWKDYRVQAVAVAVLTLATVVLFW
jgi:SSS family solute:Na+ symporter